jgi:hypothetical protein
MGLSAPHIGNFGKGQRKPSCIERDELSQRGANGRVERRRISNHIGHSQRNIWKGLPGSQPVQKARVGAKRASLLVMVLGSVDLRSLMVKSEVARPAEVRPNERSKTDMVCCAISHGQHAARRSRRTLAVVQVDVSQRLLSFRS